MNVPLELTFRGLEKTESIEALIREKAARLERFCDRLSSCRVVVEKPQAHQDRGAGFRVRVDMTVPPGHELVAHRGPTEGDLHEELQHLVRETFAAAERQLKELVERQRREVKRHPDQEVGALVESLAREEGYGFLRTADGRQIYFHRNSVVNDEFDALRVGAGVRYVEEQGDEGPQATTVQVLTRNPPKE